MREPDAGRLSHLNALALLVYAQAAGLSDIYDHVSMLLMEKRARIENLEPLEFRNLVSSLGADNLEELLEDFLKLARDRLDLTPVEIISAAPLSEEQLNKLQLKLVHMTRKQLIINATTDPSLLGGFRVLIDNSVIDCSVKRKLQDIKQAIYERVYQSDGRAPQ